MPDYAEKYAERFRAMAARGDDVHGEATFVTELVDPPARVLDAGCGTGRVAIRLAELGYDVVGVDLDACMLARPARRRRTSTGGSATSRSSTPASSSTSSWSRATPSRCWSRTPSRSAATHLAEQLDESGLLVCGFGLDAAHLPGGCPVTPLADVDAAFEAAGLEPVDRFSTWDRAPYDENAGYVVTVHRPPPPLTPEEVSTWTPS